MTENEKAAKLMISIKGCSQKIIISLIAGLLDKIDELEKKLKSSKE
jgi:hypothetical protein